MKIKDWKIAVIYFWDSSTRLGGAPDAASPSSLSGFLRSCVLRRIHEAAQSSAVIGTKTAVQSDKVG